LFADHTRDGELDGAFAAHATPQFDLVSAFLDRRDQDHIGQFHHRRRFVHD
jgi:hypothetical protein